MCAVTVCAVTVCAETVCAVPICCACANQTFLDTSMYHINRFAVLCRVTLAVLGDFTDAVVMCTVPWVLQVPVLLLGF